MNVNADDIKVDYCSELKKTKELSVPYIPPRSL
jgi:hypothetical protein